MNRASSAPIWTIQCHPKFCSLNSVFSFHFLFRKMWTWKLNCQMRLALAIAQTNKHWLNETKIEWDCFNWPLSPFYTWNMTYSIHPSSVLHVLFTTFAFDSICRRITTRKFPSINRKFIEVKNLNGICESFKSVWSNAKETKRLQKNKLNFIVGKSKQWILN